MNRITMSLVWQMKRMRLLKSVTPQLPVRLYLRKLMTVDGIGREQREVLRL